MKLLLIEDDIDDVELLEESLKKHTVQFTLEVLCDGSEAIRYIRDCATGPDVIILDFNLPKVHGRQVLLEIKSKENFKNIPLLILTTSSSKEDIEYSYNNGADKYLIKPTTIEGINETVSTILGLAKKNSP